MTTESQLHARSVETLVACWTEFARATPEAAVVRGDVSRLGFRDLGRIYEYAPAAGGGS